jgi:hypothetical protein
VFLAAHFQRATQTVWSGGECGIRIAPAHKHRWQHIALHLQCVLHRQDGGQGFDGELHLACGAARLHDGLGNHQANHLADVLHGVACEDWLVAGKGGQHRVAGDVLCQHHTHHTRHGQSGAGLHAQQAAMRHGGQDGRGMQRAADFGDVVHVGGGTGHLGHRALVRAGHAGCGG